MVLVTRALLTRRGLPALAASLVAVAGLRKPACAQPELGPPDLAPLAPLASPPRVRFLALDGAPAPLTSFLGRPVVLNFWATWCTPCVAELPELDRLAAACPDIDVIAASTDHGGAATVRDFLATHPIGHVKVLLDPQSEAANLFEVAGFPTTLVIDRTGLVRARLEGPAAWGGAAGLVRSVIK